MIDFIGKLAGCLILLAMFVVLLLGFDWACMVAWNASLVPLFHAPKVTFWQMASLVFVIGFFAGMFGKSHVPASKY